jgi:hypothetical protein
VRPVTWRISGAATAAAFVSLAHAPIRHPIRSGYGDHSKTIYKFHSGLVANRTSTHPERTPADHPR